MLAERLALEEYRFDAQFASPLKRASEVAEIIAGKLGVEVILDPRLRELHTGKVAGLTPVEAARVQPEPPGGYRTYEPIPEGESTIDHYARSLSSYCELLDKHLADSVCVVAHGGTLGHLLRIIYGNPVNSPIVGRGYLCFMNGDTAR